MRIDIRQIEQLPNIDHLVASSEREGFRFVKRLVKDFDLGINRFQAEGEALFALFDAETCVGVGGVNRDPAGVDAVGRIRRVYISPAYRGGGAGRRLIARIEAWCAGRFDCLQLFTDTAGAAGFYESLGYDLVAAAHCSHTKKLEAGTLVAARTC